MKSNPQAEEKVILDPNDSYEIIAEFNFICHIFAPLITNWLNEIEEKKVIQAPAICWIIDDFGCCRNLQKIY